MRTATTQVYNLSHNYYSHPVMDWRQTGHYRDNLLRYKVYFYIIFIYTASQDGLRLVSKLTSYHRHITVRTFKDALDVPLLFLFN